MKPEIGRLNIRGKSFGSSQTTYLYYAFQTSQKDKDQNVKVVVRCRPMNEKEVAQGCKQAVNVYRNPIHMYVHTILNIVLHYRLTLKEALLM